MDYHDLQVLDQFECQLQSGPHKLQISNFKFQIL
jgi:hypothetical protein